MNYLELLPIFFIFAMHLIHKHAIFLKKHFVLINHFEICLFYQ